MPLATKRDEFPRFGKCPICELRRLFSQYEGGCDECRATWLKLAKDAGIETTSVRFDAEGAVGTILLFQTNNTAIFFENEREQWAHVISNQMLEQTKPEFVMACIADAEATRPKVPVVFDVTITKVDR